jgi:PAS domain S-box-containing protein
MEKPGDLNMEDGEISVLLIEDNPDDAALLRRNLGKSANGNIRLTLAKSQQEGLEQLRRNAPDIILCDLGLPDSHGLDTVTKIICQAPDIPVVVLSGFDDEATAIRAVQSGAQDYLVKGRLEGAQIERSLFYAIERARLQRELEQHTQEISKYQANLHKILDKNADAIIVIGKGRRILFANRAAEAMLCRKSKDLIHRPFNFPLEKGKTSEIEIRYRKKATTIAEMNVAAIDWEGSPAYLASLHDITKRKQMMEALRESEAKFSKAFHSSANLFAINTLKDGKFIEVNDSFTRMTGYTRKEVIGHNATELDFWADEKERKNITTKTKENERVRNEQIKIRSKSGKIRYGLFSSEQITINGESCFINAITDITELKHAEESLRVSEEKFSKAFRSSPEMIVISDIEDGTVLEANDTFLHLTGYAPAEVIGKKSLEVGIWAVPEERAEMTRILQAEGKVVKREYLFRMKSGETRTWLFSAEIINIDNKPCMLSVNTDITELKKAMEELRYSDTALKSIHEGVFALDNEFRITRWNKMCEQMFGIKAIDAIGRPVGEVITMVEEYPGQNTERIDLLVEKGFNKEEQIYQTPRGDIWVDVQAQAIEDNGQHYGWVTLVSDITQRKQTEETLRFSDAAFKSIHESVVATDTKYVITHWNKISEQMYGIKASQAKGRKLKDIIEIVENFPGENAQRLKRLENEGYYQEEQLHRTKQGEVWADVSMQAIEEDGKRYGWVMLASAITQRKLAEEALKRSEEKYRELISTSIDGIVSNDAQMRIIIWNRGAERIFGYSEREMLGQPVTKFIPEKEWKNIKKVQHTLKTAGGRKTRNLIIEGFGLKKDGQEIPIELSVSSKGYGDARIATAIIRDISERKEAEEKLRESEERYRDLFENASDLIQSVAPDGHFVFVNKAWHRALGYTEKEVARLVLWDIIHPDYIAHCQEIFQKVMAGETDYIETVFVAKNGKAIHVEGNANNYCLEGKIMATRGIFRDVTERKEAEERLRESEESYRDLFENASDFIQSVAQDAHFIYVNKAWRDALGYSKQEIANLVLWDIIHPDDIKRCRNIFCTVMAGKAFNNVETVFVTKNGKLIHVEGNVNVVFKEGKVVATRAIFRDITERKEAEEKLRKIDRMKSEFLSNVSHELRTPLQSVSGFTKLLLNGQVPDPATQQEFLGIIDRETSYLGNLINSLLDMSRLESGRFQINKTLTDLRGTINDSIKSFQPIARDKNIILTGEIPPNLPEIDVDSGRIRQVFFNLLSNAVKYSDPGGSVMFRVEKRQKDLLFQVTDRGIGMSRPALQHLFERFYRAEDKLARGGTGLGLYITKQIIEAHGGHIWVKSKINEGSTFSFDLPLNGKGGNGHDKENSGHRRRPGHIKAG